MAVAIWSVFVLAFALRSGLPPTEPAKLTALMKGWPNALY